MFRKLVLLSCIVALAGCQYMPKLDKVIPDRKTEYKKSKSLPDLEVPPDLTTGAMNDSMAIPNEGPATLSKYQRQRAGTTPQAAGTTVAETPLDEHTVTVHGSADEAWDKLKEFFTQKGYGLDIFDKQLGVLETAWSEPITDAGIVYRYRFKVISDEGSDPNTTLLYVSNMRQEQTTGTDGTKTWVDREKNDLLENQVAGDIGRFINGSGSAVASTASAAGSKSAPANEGRISRAEVKSAGDGKVYLAIPDEFTMAWRHTEAALRRAGFTISGADQAKGTYDITFFDSADATEKKGWLSKLAFWKSDKPHGIPYKLSLTGVGDHSELVVLNEKGDWETNDDADRILAIIQNQYNAAGTP